jgi:hypothetical protein
MNATVKPPKQFVAHSEDAKNGKKHLPTADRQALIAGLNHDLALQKEQ